MSRDEIIRAMYAAYSENEWRKTTIQPEMRAAEHLSMGKALDVAIAALRENEQASHKRNRP